MKWFKASKRNLLKHIIKQNQKIMDDLDEIKADLEALNTAADGVKKDLDFLKAKLEASPGGLTSAQTREVLALVKAAKDKFVALDAETNSDETTTEPVV